MTEQVFYGIIYAIIFVYGLCFGSFSNVCILRLPLKENITGSSHCMSCGYKLRWFDLFPLFSYLFLGGKCRKCKAKISIQYPIVEGLNGLFYVLIFWYNGFNVVSGCYCLATTALIALSVVDWRTMEIPDSFNVFILVMGIVATIFDRQHWVNHLVGMICVSLFLFLIGFISSLMGRDAMGGGDIKLMFCAGLLVGAKCIVIAFLVGCIVGSVIHLVRMAVTKADHQLAFGPYLAFGIVFSMFFGNPIANWYFGIIARSIHH